MIGRQKPRCKGKIGYHRILRIDGMVSRVTMMRPAQVYASSASRLIPHCASREPPDTCHLIRLLPISSVHPSLWHNTKVLQMGTDFEPAVVIEYFISYTRHTPGDSSRVRSWDFLEKRKQDAAKHEEAETAFAEFADSAKQYGRVSVQTDRHHR